MEKPYRILVVDDEVAIADLVKGTLEREGMEVTACYRGAEALCAFGREPFDLVILDIMMPDIDGFELCGRMRAISDVPIVFLSAKDQENDQVVGFTLGADDYITKPFKSRELVARIKARLRRARHDQATLAEHNDDLLSVLGVEVDVGAHTASFYGEPLRLTPKEFDILALLMRKAGTPVSTKSIFETVWEEPYDISAGNTIMVHIRHLRAKLADIDSSTPLIETVWGVGYKMLSEKR